MLKILLLAWLASAVAPAAPASERRCGWLHNPTPANWWLVDRDGEWLLGAQGGYQAPGMDEMPDMTSAGWVETNGHYGHGCACMDVTVEGGAPGGAPPLDGGAGARGPGPPRPPQAPVPHRPASAGDVIGLAPAARNR